MLENSSLQFREHKLRASSGQSASLREARLWPLFYFVVEARLPIVVHKASASPCLTEDPTLVQPHLNKAFEGIAKVRFDSKCLDCRGKLREDRCPANHGQTVYASIHFQLDYAPCETSPNSTCQPLLTAAWKPNPCTSHRHIHFVFAI